MNSKIKLILTVLLCCTIIVAFIASAGCLGSFFSILENSGGSLSIEAKTANAVSQAIEPSNPTVRSLALNAIKSKHGGNYNVNQICDVYEYLYKHWTYVNDPNSNSDYYAKASESARLMKGDCDDFAILMASCIEAIGGGSRVIIAESSNGDAHAYAEVYFAKDKTDKDSKAKSLASKYHDTIYLHPDSSTNPTSYWLNLDWSATHPGGKYYASIGNILIIYPNGYYNLEGFTVQNGWS